MRCYAGGREATTTPTALRGAQLESSGSGHPAYVLEVGVFNTTTTACTAALARFTASGTIGATWVESAEDDTFVPLFNAGGVNSTDATATASSWLVNASIGAAIGAGVIWTFGGKGIRIPGTADAGVFIPVPNGTGQFRDGYFVWEE